MRQNQPPTPWMSFVLQGALGLIFGPILGRALIHRRYSGFWLQDEYVWPFLVGSAFALAGLSSRHGDRLWLGRHSSSLFPTPYVLSRIQLGLSILLLVLGVGLMVGCLLLHFLR